MDFARPWFFFSIVLAFAQAGTDRGAAIAGRRQLRDFERNGRLSWLQGAEGLGQRF